MPKTFKIGKYFIVIGLSRKNTCWWDNIVKHKCRVDSLVAFDRVYYRNVHKYVYRLVLGRLKILFVKANI
jgi:hypothetical protein